MVSYLTIVTVIEKHVNSPMELTVVKENLFKNLKLELMHVVHEPMEFSIMKIPMRVANSISVIRALPMKCLVFQLWYLMYQLDLVSEQKKPLLRPEYAIVGKRLMVDSKQLKASHALARKQLDTKDYCKHIQYFLTLLIANFSSHALARKQLDPKDYCKHIQYI